jgi:CRISPR-associated protein Cas8a1/Csx13
MDLLERAGLAGLYMALRAAREAKVDLSPLVWIDAELTTDSVTVRWAGPAKPAFEKLMKWAWQVENDVLYLPAIHGERELAQFHLRTPSHTGIMRTFLQHTNVQPKGEPITRLVQLDENREILVSYQPPVIRVAKERPKKGRADATATGKPKPKGPPKLLKPWKDLDDLFDRDGGFSSSEVELSNWVYPGIAGRYGEEGAWVGPPNRAVLLMLGPTVCLFLRLQGQGGNWVFVLPDVRDLADFDETRRRMNLDADFTDVASMGDAALQFLAAYSTRNPRKLLRAGCRVVAMGKVRYYASQSIRKAVLDVPPNTESVRRYRLLHGTLPNNYVSLQSTEPAPESAKQKSRANPKKPTEAETSDGTPKAKGFIKLPGSRGRIADNLVNGRPWYENLLVPQIWDLDEMERQRKKKPGTSIERLWFEGVRYQRSKLMKLIQEEAMWDTEAERVFVEAFWETLKALYRREGDAAKDRGGARSATDRMEDLNEEVRRSLVQAKTHSLLRERLAEFFSRPVKNYRSQALAKHAPVIWRLVDSDWKKGRDLALLALATYMSEEKRNPTAGATTIATATTQESDL